MTGHTAHTGRSWRNLLGPALVIAAAVGAYADTVRNGFLADDIHHISDNSAIRDLSNIPRFFVEPPPGQINRNYYRPVLMASLAIEFAIFGDSPAGFHATSILVHGIASLFAFLLAGRIFRNRRSALVVGLLFAVHPIHGEVVYAVAYRCAAFSALFVFAGLLLNGASFNTRVGQIVGRVGTGLFAFLAAASKEDAVIFPLLLLLDEVCLEPRRSFARTALRICPAVIGAGVCFTIRTLVCEPSGIAYFSAVPWDTAFRTVFIAQAVGLRSLVMPSDLAANWGADAIAHSASFADPRFWLALLLAVALVGVAVWYWRRNRVVSFAILFHMLAILPTLHLVGLPTLFGERYLYIASFGFCLAVAVAYQALDARIHPRGLLAVIGALVIVGMGTFTHLRAREFRSERTALEALVRDRPRNLQGRYSLANALQREGRCVDALPHFDAAAAMAPNSPDGRQIHIERASCYFKVGSDAKAAAALELWLATHPDDLEIRNMLAKVRSAQGPPP